MEVGTIVAHENLGEGKVKEIKPNGHAVVDFGSFEVTFDKEGQKTLQEVVK